MESREEMIAELERCKESPEYFISKYCRLKDKEGNIVRFENVSDKVLLLQLMERLTELIKNERLRVYMRPYWQTKELDMFPLEDKEVDYGFHHSTRENLILKHRKKFRKRREKLNKDINQQKDQ